MKWGSLGKQKKKKRIIFQTEEEVSMRTFS